MAENRSTDKPRDRSISTSTRSDPRFHKVAEPSGIWKVASGVELLDTRSGLAAYLGVSRTQPGRWLDGEESPKPETARLIKDLDYVWDRLRTEMGAEAAKIWMHSPNGFLNGTTPLDWLKRLGPADVISALDAAEAGSYV